MAWKWHQFIPKVFPAEDPNDYTEIETDSSPVGFSWGAAQPMKHWRDFFKKEHVGMVYLELCNGAGSTSQALKCLEGQYTIFQYDKNENTKGKWGGVSRATIYTSCCE